MIKIGIKEHPCAYKAAETIHTGYNLNFPINVSTLLENISTHKIFDVSSNTYNAAFAKNEEQKLFPKKAWSLFSEYLDVYLIIWNASLPSSSIRYSVAHEIGHIILNHERAWPTDIDIVKRQKEAEANVFASCLLAPFEAIHKLCLPHSFSAGLVAEYFDIPLAAAKGLKYDYEYWLLFHK